ncbi:hypothetical protein ACSEUU_02775 [Pseudomonas aeruginosa]
MTNELNDVRCPCGAEFQADSYDAGFIAGSGMCQNCDAAMPPKDIPAPVEQAGGDERAVDGKPRATKCPDCGEGDLMPGDLCACGYETDPAAGYACSECDGSGDGCVGEVCRECDGTGWFVTPEQARATLAQPSPAQAEQAEAERPEVVATMYTHHDDVDFREFVVVGNCDKGCEGFYGPEKLMTVAQHERIVGELRADRDSWAEQAEQRLADWDEMRKERDAALAKVERLRESKGDPSGSFDRCMKMMYERDENAKRLDAALARVAELEKGTVYVEARQCDECQHVGINDSADGLAACHDCDWTGPEPDEDKCPDCQRENCMAAACPQCGARYVLVASEEIAAPVAQAQHSVPEGVTIERDVAGTIHIKVGDFDFIQLQYQRPYTDNASTWKLAERIASLLAAAPGKEGL